MHTAHVCPSRLTILVVLTVVLMSAAISLADAGSAGQSPTAPPAWDDRLTTPPDPQAAAAHRIYLPISFTPAPPPPSSVLIAEALARGEIDSETALIYNVYAVFADARLPARFRGDDSRLRDSFITQEVRSRFPSLSGQTQALLAPFLLPPSAPGSWLELREHATPTASVSQQALAPTSIRWHKELVGDKPAVVWWQERYQTPDEAKAKMIASELSGTIWKKLTDLMGGEPITDAGMTNNGGDGRLDVYLIHAGNNGNYGEAQSYLGACGYSTPAADSGYMLINTQQDQWLRNTVAHEFFHVLQWRYKTDCYKKDYYWLLESTATWAEDVVYKDDNSEWDYLSDFLDEPNTSLEDPGNSTRLSPNPRFYGAYLWPFYLSHATPGPGNAVVPAIFASSENHEILQAVNDNIPGGFKQQWPEFALRNWNKDPVEDYRTWDGIARGIAVDQITDLRGTLGGARSASDDLVSVQTTEHLAASYYHVVLDNDIHRVTFFNGLDFKLSKATVTGAIGFDWLMAPPSWRTSKWEAGGATSAQNREHAHIWLIPSVNGIWQEPEDVTQKAYRTFCRDVFDEAVDELIIVVSNSAWQDSSFKPVPEGEPPTLFYSNIPCGRWKGEVHSTPPMSGYQVTADITGVELAADGLVGDAPESQTGFLVGTGYKPTAGTLRTSGSFNYSSSCVVNMNNYSNGVGPSFPGDGHLMTVNEFALDGFFGRYAMLFADATHGDMVCDDGTTGPWPPVGLGAGMWPLSLVITDNPGYQTPFTVSVYDPMHVSLDGKSAEGNKTVSFSDTAYWFRWSFAAMPPP